MKFLAAAQAAQKPSSTGGVLQRQTQAHAKSCECLSCACGKKTANRGFGEKLSQSSDGEKRLQRSSGRGVDAASTAAPAIVHDVLQAPGQPLDNTARVPMERGFNREFSHVRVHTDAKAAESARAVNARAYTVGRDVVFGAGEYSPRNESGLKLIAHELGHVVQQQGATVKDEIEIASASDAREQEANRAAAAALSMQPTPAPATTSEQRLQRSVLGDIGDALAAPFVALYHLFGGDYYRKETLQEYLKGLKDRGAIEDHYDSDNKARACVKREGELGPYNTATKTLLIREMLKGYTSGSDEKSISTLLTRAAAAERTQIVNSIGRETIWSNFSGHNRRVVEAVTLTAADAKGNALIARFRNMPADDLQDYVDNALDADVKAAAQRAAMLQKITAPVPDDAAVRADGAATFKINGFDVEALPDTTSNDEKLRNRAVTQFGVFIDQSAQAQVGAATNTVNSFTPPHLLARVQTVFGPGYDPTGRSGYGRGTTSEDVSSGNTTLRFHESRHAQDWFDFLAAHAAPVFQGQVGMSWDDFQKAQTTLENEIQKYNKDASDFSLKKTDCPGVQVTDEQLRPFGLSAAICHEN